MMIKNILLAICLMISVHAFSQSSQKTETEFYGSIWFTTDYNFQSSDPRWFEMLRPTKILNDNGQPFSANGVFSVGVRPSRFGVKVNQPTDKGAIKAQFDFDLVGGGPNVGTTYFRVFNAYAEWNRITIGQRNSIFMDGSVVPNTVDFFGPNGIVLLRNVQISYKAIETEKEEFAFGLENPSATSDLGQYGEDFDYTARLESVRFITKAPAFTAHYRRNFKNGHFQIAGVAKYAAWDDAAKSATQNLSGSDWGYGVNLTGSYKIAKNVRLIGAFVTGSGVQNFLNDGTADIGVRRNYTNSFKPIYGEAIPFYSFMGFTEINWNSKLSSAFGYSAIHNNSFETQLSTAFESGGYATANIMYKPVKQVALGFEYQYASRQNTNFAGDPFFGLPAAKGNSFHINKLQLMLVYRFSTKN
jgi:hypothetical protein